MKIESVYSIGDVLGVQDYTHDVGEYMFGEVKQVHVEQGGKISYTIDFGYPINKEGGRTIVVNETPQSGNEYYTIVYKVGENKNNIVTDQI